MSDTAEITTESQLPAAVEIPTSAGIWKMLGPLGKPLRWTRNLAVILVLAAMASAFTTYAVMTNTDSPFGPDPRVVMMLAVVNLILLLSLVAVVAHRAYKLWLALKRGSVGSRLQTRIVLIFSLITMIPTSTVAIFSALFLNAGIEAWFSERVNTGLEESVAVAEAYLSEHRNLIRADARAMANDIDRALYEGLKKPSALNQIVSGQAALRSLTEAVILQRGQVLAQTSLSFSLAFEGLPAQTMEMADSGQMVVIADDDKIRAVIKLKSLPDSFLIVGRLIDERVVKHMENTQAAVNEYRQVKSKLSNIQIQFSSMFILVALLLLLAAIWYGMYFAARLVVPISHLIEAAERVRAGDYATRVGEGPKDDELATLGRAFNRMTNQLASQRRDLMKANRQLDSRRRFSEAVLAGVSAGVIALDNNRLITLHNRSALKLLRFAEDKHLEELDIAEVLPEVLPQLEQVMAQPDQLAQADVTVQRNEKQLTLHVRIAAQVFDGELESFILTFDDITPLVSAQRSAAWADVARRVAHEIKNPLTPIQLSAERLKRKYAKQIDESERDNFTKYTETIIRHVGDIGRMVEEFVRFARLPAPVFTRENIGDLLTKTVFSEETAHSRLSYVVDLPEEEIFADVDASQIRQVITNLVKNAAEAIESQKGEKGKEGGRIIVSAAAQDGHCIIEVKDNGNGFPTDQMHQLLEPYVTTRVKGTGLGLAIVKKILEDHHGRVELDNRPEGGALVRLVLPLDLSAKKLAGKAAKADKSKPKEERA